MGSVCIRAFVATAIVCLNAGCSNESASRDATSESFVGSAGTVIGGKEGIRSIASRMNHDAIGLADGSAVTRVEQEYDAAEGRAARYVYHALEFVPASGDRAIQVDVPAPFEVVVPGPEGSALVIAYGAGDERELHRVSPSGSELVAKGNIGGATTAADGSIVWFESGESPKMHRRRGGQVKTVSVAKDPYERTFADCRTFLQADADRVYDVCISGFAMRSSDRVERVRTFAADGSLEAEVILPTENFGGIRTGFDGSGNLLILDTAYTGDGIKNVGVHGYRYDPRTKSAAVLKIPVFVRTERWRPYAIIPTSDGGCALAGNANDRFAMVKLLADGTLDETFDEDGAMSAGGPDDWGILVSGRTSADGKRIELLGFGADGRDARTYRLAISLR